MDTIQDIINFLLILIPVGTAVRCALCLMYASMEEDPAPYKKKLRNALIFAALSECITEILKLVVTYFGGDVIY